MKTKTMSKATKSFIAKHKGAHIHISGCSDIPTEATCIIVGNTEHGSYLVERLDGGGWNRNSDVPKKYVAYDKDNPRFWWVTLNSTTIELIAKDTQEVLDKRDNALDKLVIGDDERAEIESVLKQQDKAIKLFEEWGLGETIKYGKGMTMLFYGKAGTGKTFASHCIAEKLGKKLLVVGSAQIQTSEPGGAERNIIQAFATARQQGSVLLLDECDSLITNRNEVGMIIGSEINTLLTEIEKFEGVCILTTNRAKNLDEALERRISLILEFKEPEYQERAEIWKRLIPKKLPLADDVSIEKLAEHKLTGGQIKNALLSASRLAMASDMTEISMSLFEHAIARLQKSKNLLGTASRWRDALVKTKTDEISLEPIEETYGSAI